ncbi:MAG: exo-alpha-sialidase [Sandaracinaceae bacterium]|nr:exo-alpha-sialidase [Sandaracinaceae bacterium]
MPDPEGDDDDDALAGDLGAMTPLDDEDEPLGVEGLGVEGLGVELDGAGDGETVGLDDSAGLEEGDRFFELELPVDRAVDEEDFDAIPLVEGLGGDDEYGWIDDAADPEERWDADDHELPHLTPLGRDEDRGDEGVDDVFDLGGRDADSASHLPPLAEHLDADEDEGIDLELSLPTMGDGETELPPLLEGARVERLLEVSTRDVVVQGGSWWAATVDGLYRDGARLEATGLVGSPRSIAWAHGVLLVGTDRGAFRSADDGRTFAHVDALGTAAVRLEAEAGGMVWACGATGRLQRSDDAGVTWSPPLLLTRVAAMASPGTGLVTLSAPDAARPQVASSDDGGRRWAASDAPALERPSDGRDYGIAAAGGHVALASPDDPGGPFLSEDQGRTWVRVPGLPPAEAIALRVDGRVVLYAAHRLGEGTAVVRHEPHRDSGSGLLVEGCARVHRLVPVGADDLLVATEAGLLEVSLRGAP